MKSTIPHQIPNAVPAILLGLALAGCCCKSGHSGHARSHPNDPPELPADCRPTAQLARFNSDTRLVFNPDGLNNAAGYRWFQLKQDEFVPVTESANKYQNVTSNVLTIIHLRPEDVAHYAFLKKPDYKDAFCENRVFSLMGYTNTGGSITVWGSPLTSGGNSSANTCNNLPCPGTYTRKVDYDWGWRPISFTVPCSVQDGNSTTTKIRYWGASTAPLCGCNGSLNIPSPNPNKIYTFTLYFPSTVIPLNPHPLVINNMIPEP